MSFDKNSLLPFLANDGLERVGFVLKDGSIVEVENVCADPTNGFEVKGEDLVEYPPRSIATWHTHPDPSSSSNLSVDDHSAFLAYPELRHFIVGQDGVSEYYVENDTVFNRG